MPPYLWTTFVDFVPARELVTGKTLNEQLLSWNRTTMLISFLLAFSQAYVIIGLSFALFATFVTPQQIESVCTSKAQYVRTLGFLILFWPVVLLFKAKK